MSRRATKEGEDPLYQKTLQQLKDELSQKGIRTSSTKKAELVVLLRDAIDKSKSKPKKQKFDTDESEGKKSTESDEDKGKKDDKKHNKDSETSKDKEKKPDKKSSKTTEEKEPKTNEERERKSTEEKEPPTTQEKDETSPKSNKTDTTDGDHKSELEKSRQTKLQEDEETHTSTEDTKQISSKNDTKSKHTSGSMDTVISTDMLDDLISQESGKVTENPNSKKRSLEDDMDKDDGMKEEKKEEEKIDDKELPVRKKKRTQETPAPNPVEQHNANRVVPESTTPPTDTLHIKHFVRPFHNSSLKKMLEEHGNVTHFWINHIKSFCFVTYKTVEEAIKTRNAVHNLIWPPNNRGQPLVTEFITFEESKEQIENYGKDPIPAPGVVPKNVLPPQKPAKTLDELFRRTTIEPRIYYLPLTQDEVNNKLTSLGQPPFGSQQPTQSPTQPPIQQRQKEQLI